MRKNLKPILMLAGMLPTMAFAAPLEAPQIGGQGFVSGISVNTANAWETTKNADNFVGYDLPLKIEEQSLWNAWKHGHIRQLPYLAQSDGAVIYPLGQITPILQTCPGNYSLIVLNRGAVPEKMLGAPSGFWNVETGVAGDHAIIAVSPIYPGLKSNLQVMATGPHGNLITYSVDLTSGKTRYTPKLSFYRAEHRLIKRSTPILLKQNGSLPHTVMADTSPDAVHLSVNWKMQCVTGRCQDIMPVVVANTPHKVFVHFRHAQKSPPMILPRTRSGASWYAPSHLENGGKTLVIEGSPYQVDLLEEGHDGVVSEVRLTQEGSAK